MATVGEGIKPSSESISQPNEFVNASEKVSLSERNKNYESADEVNNRLDKKYGAEFINSNDIRYSSRETLSEASKKMETIADEEYLKDKQDTPFILVMEHTPKVILDSMDGSNDRKILIRRDALYLAIREDGIQEGHYHGLGKEVLSKLPEHLEQPDVVLSTIDPETKAENKSRRLVLTHIPTKNGQAIVSIEFESLKDFEGKNDYFNMIITVFDLHENYLKRQFKKFGAKVKYIKEDLAQVNPQLFEWLRTINARSSTGSISHSSDSVNTSENFSLSERTDNAIDNRTLLANAFESVAQNDVERSWLLKYKLQIVKLNEDQNKLAELRAEIRKIRFTEGQDRSKLTALENQAEKMFNITIEPEKEIVMIIVNKENRDAILHALYKEVGLNTPGQGIAFALPVDKVVGLSERKQNTEQ